MRTFSFLYYFQDVYEKRINKYTDEVESRLRYWKSNHETRSVYCPRINTKIITKFIIIHKVYILNN